MDINTMDTHKTGVGEILDSLRVLVASLASASRASEIKLGITGAQHFVMQKLMEGGELSVNELAERTHTHQSTVSTVVSKLVAKHLVLRRRSDSDARVQLLTLTAQGKQKLRKPTDTIQDRLIRSIESLSGPDRRQLNRLLGTVLQTAGLEHNRPALFFESAAASKARKVTA
jgi:DNA-binding MarR family transcriptional regulator